ncbi:FtsK/SpoIIIE domain-containing protein [Streptomyces sp. NPDC002526]
MGKRRQGDSNADVISGELAGAIGVLVIVTGGLAAIKDRLGLSWTATVLITAGVLVLLGYLTWKARRLLARLLAGEIQTSGTPKAEMPETAETENGGDGAPIDAHLTTALSRAGAIGKDECILAEDVRTERLPVGIVYEFLMPRSRTHEHVANRLGPIASMLGVTRLHLKLETSRKSERHVRLLVLDAPPFSNQFPAPTRQEIQGFPGVALGHEVTGKLGGVPTFDKASLLVGGMTQSGKTTFVNGLITCLLIAYGEFDLYLLDGKMCGLTRFEKIAVRYEASDDPAVMESILDELLIRVDSRYTEMQDAIRNRKPAPKFRPVFFIIDEAADFYTHNGTPESKELVRRVEDKSRSLVAKALESSINTVMLTQRPARDAIPVKVRDQFLYRMCLYVASEGSAKVALGDTYFETVAPIHPALLDSTIKGQGVLFAHGTSTLIRGFDFPDTFIWEIVDEVAARREKAIPDSPLKKAIDLMRNTGVEFMRTPDLAAALGITETNAVKRGKELNARLGVRSDRDGKGDRGYWLADLLAAATAGK